MKRIWTAAMLAAIIAGIGLVPAAVYGGRDYERHTGQERPIMVRADLFPEVVTHSAVRPVRERYQTTSDPPCYERAEISRHKAEVTYYAARPCGERTVKPCPTPKKVEIRCAHPCPSPCLNDIRRTSRELREVLKENERLRESVQIHQEHDRVNLIERQNLEKENATWRERVRNREAWIEDYRAKYIEHNGWR